MELVLLTPAHEEHWLELASGATAFQQPSAVQSVSLWKGKQIEKVVSDLPKQVGILGTTVSMLT